MRTSAHRAPIDCGRPRSAREAVGRASIDTTYCSTVLCSRCRHGAAPPRLSPSNLLLVQRQHEVDLSDLLSPSRP